MNLKKEFESVILDEFRFLKEEFDFLRIPIKRDFFVRYESNLVYITISYDEYSYEIGFSIGLLGLGKSEYYLNEILQLYSNQMNINDIGIQASNLKDLTAVLNRMSAFLKKNSEKILRGDIEEFSKLRTIRSSNFKRQKDSWNRSKLNEYWEIRDYEGVIKYGKEVNSLTEAEKKKLEYSKKKVTGNKS